VGGGTPACVVARLSRYADTVDIAGVAFRLVCAYPKPRFWARRRPEFLTARRPDVTVAITYDEHFRRRAGWPAGGETVDDATHVRGHGRRLRVTTGYYRAAVDVRRGRAAVRIAAGFDVGHLMRTLAALWLLERNTLLLRAGPAGYVAVAPREGEMTVRLTPFGDHGAQPGSARPRAVPIVIGTAGSQAAGPQGSARALAALLPAIWQADRRRAAVTRTLELASLIIAARRRRDGDARPAGSALVG
jgi:hypothetical protein